MQQAVIAGRHSILATLMVVLEVESLVDTGSGQMELKRAHYNTIAYWQC